MSRFTTIVCDRCGRKFDRYGSKVSLAVIDAIYDEKTITIKGTEASKDLCDKCQSDLLAWFYPEKNKDPFKYV